MHFVESNYNAPYIWPSQIDESFMAFCNENTFTHVHIQGRAGTGKSRCVHEIIKNASKPNIILSYISQEMQKHQDDIIKIFTTQIESQIEIKSLSRADKKNDLYAQIENTSSTNPVIIFIDDLHYADDIRDTFINRLIYNLADKQKNVTLITTSRYSYDLSSQENVYNISLASLSSKDVGKIISQKKLNSRYKKEIQENLTQQCNGFPLFLYEALNILDFSLDKEDNNQFNLDRFYKTQNFQDLYSFFLSSLNDTQKDILYAGSIIGNSFDLDEINTLLPQYKLYSKAILDHLSENNFLRNDLSKNLYSFTHDLQRQSIKNSVPPIEKNTFHIALFQHYKKFRKHILCGLHLFEAGEYLQAIPYLTYTARSFLKKSHPKKADSFFKKAFVAFERSLQNTSQPYIKLQIDYIHSLLMQGRVKDANVIYRELQSLIKQSQYTSNKSILGLEILIKWMTGEYTKDYIVNTLKKMPVTADYFTDRSRLLGMLSDIGEHKESIKQTKKLLADIEKSKNWKETTFAPTELSSYILLSVNYALVNDRAKALKYINKNLKAIKNIEDSPEKIYPLTFTAKALQILGNFKEARPLLDDAYKLNIKYNIGIIFPHTISQCALNYLHEGNPLKAMELFNQCFIFVKENEYNASIPYYRILIAKAYSLMGMYTIAIKILNKAKHLSQKLGNEYFLAITYSELSLLLYRSSEKKHHKIADGYITNSLNLSIKNNWTQIRQECEKIIHSHAKNRLLN